MFYVVEVDRVGVGGAELGDAVQLRLVPREEVRVEPVLCGVQRNELEHSLQVLWGGVAAEALEKFFYVRGNPNPLARQQLVKSHAVMRTGAASGHELSGVGRGTGGPRP